MRIKIEKLVYGGEGLAHAGGATLFVPFVLPGEEVEVTETERSKKFSRCKLDRVLGPSADRIEPACRHFGECGGCQYQHIVYEAQLRFKEQILRETLRRLGRLDWTLPITVHPSPPFSYRNRAQWKIRFVKDASTQTAPSSGNGNAIGYFRERSSVLCPVETCPVLSPGLSGVFDSLRAALAKSVLPKELIEAEAFAGADDRKFLLTLTCSSLRKMQGTIAEDLMNLIPGIESVLLQETAGDAMELRGPGYINYTISEKPFRVGHLSFFQVNRHLVEVLARTVTVCAGNGNLAIDLYAGVGLLATFLAGNFRSVEAVEADPAAARDLGVNAAVNGNNISSHNMTAAAFLAKCKSKRASEPADAIILDPPRAGLEPAALRALLDISAPRVLYVSCDPSTLARDLAQLCARMYKVQEIHLFDMFPQTYHIETLVRLERVS